MLFVTEESRTPQTAFDDALVSRLAGRLDDAPVMSTGAGHDAGILANAGVPAAMIFVRNPTGVSHSPAERAEPEDCLAGVAALATVLADLAGGEQWSSYWAAYAWLPDGCRAGVGFDVEDGRFAGVQVGVEPRAGEEILRRRDASGSRQRPQSCFPPWTRGRTHAGGGSFWTWREEMYALAARLDPDSYLSRSRRVRRDGTGRIHRRGEFHYLHHDQHGRPYADPNAMGRALIQAATEAGVRLTLIDACYLAGGLAATGHLRAGSGTDPLQRQGC